jgi:peptidyl-Lys metalloendopeptidase
MFSSALLAALFSLLLSCVAVLAAPALSVHISGHPRVVGIHTLKVVVAVQNTGDTTLKLLNDPNGPLSILPTHTFKVTNTDGGKPDFNGIIAKYVPEVVVNNGVSSTFTVLKPGESTEVTHDLSEAYDFKSSGHGGYALQANKHFLHVNDNKTIVPITATGKPYKFSLSGKLSVLKGHKSHSRRATYNSCSYSQRTALDKAATNGNAYAQEAYKYTLGHTSGTPRYTTWFGAYTTTRHNTVVNHYYNIQSHSFTQYTFDCSCKDAGVYAYVYPNDFGKVYLCGAYWSAPATGKDSQAGTLIHESSHFSINGGTYDYVYGQSGCKSLAQSNPDEAVNNADCHEYFCENTSKLL